MRISFLLFFVLITQTLAIYQNEVGILDWKLESVGRVDSAFFFDDRIIVATNSNIISSLHLPTGNIQWKQLLPQDRSINFMTQKKNKIAIVSKEGRFLSVWRETDGAQIWENLGLEGAAHSADSLFAQFLETSDLIAFVLSDSIQLRSSSDGRLIWSKNLRGEAQTLVEIDRNILSIEKRKKEDGVVVEIEGFKIESGDSISFKSAIKDVTFSDIFVLGPHIITLDSSRTLLSVYEIRHDSLTFVSKSAVSSVLEGEREISGFLSSKTSTSFLVRTSSSRIGCISLQSTTLKGIHVFHPQDKVEYASFEANEQEYIAQIQIKQDQTDILLLNVLSQNLYSVPSTSAISSKQNGFVHKFFVGGKDKYLIVTEDHGLTLLNKKGEVRWHRDEGVASIDLVQFVDLPPDQSQLTSLDRQFHETEHGFFLLKFIHRVQSQIHQLKDKVDAFAKSWEELEWGKVFRDEKGGQGKDRLGFQKLIVGVSSSSCSIFGLHSFTGSLLWKKHVPCTSSSDSSDFRAVSLYQLRSSVHFPPLSAVLFNDRHGQGSKVFVFNPLDGEEMETIINPYPILQSLLLPETDSSFTKLMLLIDSNLQGHVIPSSTEADSIFAANVKNIFFYLTSSSEVVGYRFDLTKKAVQHWKLDLAGPLISQQKVVTELKAIASVLPGERVQSAVRILGNRSVEAKYLNPNLLALAATSSNVAQSQHSVLDLYLIDSVTGQMLHHGLYKDVHGPVHLLASENWVALHFWNQDAMKFQFSILELSESQVLWNRTRVSAFELEKPVVREQAYFFHSAVKAIGITTTARGITSKHILVVTPEEQLIGIHKKFLDPRRPPKEKFTEDDAEEGLVPYSHFLTLPLDSYLSYNNTISGVRGLITAAARVESTTLVLAFGVDLFLVRVAPSGTYDLLNPDFSYEMLILTVVILVVATVVASFYARRADLSKAWR